LARHPREVTRHLTLILGDQLDPGSAAFEGFDPSRDTVLMIEASEEATHVWSHKARIAYFLSAMRHFARELEIRGIPLEYIRGDSGPASLSSALRNALSRHRPQKLIMVEPGEHRVLRDIVSACEAAGTRYAVRDDRHFLLSTAEFRRWAGTKRELRMEHFYRVMRRRTGVLMKNDLPEGGRWNYDRENRAGFGVDGPGRIPPPPRFRPDAITREVIAEVEQRFPHHPGRLDTFAWPVNRKQALAALQDFVDHRLAVFGCHQDAMWSGEPFLAHSLLAAALNLKLLNPREVIDRTLAAYRARGLPLASVEGFLRQVLGWREFIRGVYWLDMPGLADANHYGHRLPLPRWYWTGETHMRCLSHVIHQTLQHGYAHHIQRLMVTGNFALLAGIEPRQVCDWYLAVYVDAVEWAELPNTVGMALHANRGRFTSKPYAASGAYIKRMSNYCRSCKYRPEIRHGAQACPLTTLYWDFLARNRDELAGSPRTSLMARNLERLPKQELDAIRRQAATLRDRLDLI